MGLLQSRSIKSAIKSDGLQTVKKAAFSQCAIDHLKSQTQILLQNVESELEQRLSDQIKYIEKQKDLCATLFNTKANEISLKDPELIDRLQAKRRKSFKEISGYKRLKSELQQIRNRLIRGWNSEASKYLREITEKSQQLKQKLLTETPNTLALNKLSPQMRQKVFAQFIDDDAYDIEKDEFKSRAVDQLEKVIGLENVLQNRFSDQGLKEEVNKRVEEFRYNLQGIEFQGEGCRC